MGFFSHHLWIQSGLQKYWTILFHLVTCIIVTYPKSGTMWTLQIVSLIQNGGGQKDKHNTEAIPWLEQIGKKAAYVSVLCS